MPKVENNLSQIGHERSNKPVKYPMLMAQMSEPSRTPMIRPKMMMEASTAMAIIVQSSMIFTRLNRSSKVRLMARHKPSADGGIKSAFIYVKIPKAPIIHPSRV